MECGIGVKNYNDVRRVGDMIEVFEIIARTIALFVVLHGWLRYHPGHIVIFHARGFTSLPPVAIQNP